MRPLLSAEMLKLSRQPAILFWGFLSVPLVALLFKLVVEGLLFVRLGRQGGEDIDIFLSAAKSLNLSGNSIGQLIYAIGIASLFFLEYRHATWRVLVPRQPRVQLFAAKGLLCLMWLALGLLVAAIGDVAINLGLSVLKGQGSGGPVFSGASFVIFVAAFGVALLELTVLTAFVATLVVFFRSMIAAVIPAFLLAIGSTVLQLYLGADADRLPLPSYAAQWMRDWVIMGGSPLAGLTGLGVLAGWAIILFALGLYLFSRQQLATE
ncbi:ABC transporter permease [Rhizobium wuzhouense]|nr:ABC transporter permease [Rhizobium wuzhouense]